jgi:N-glycosylase/DNA lyase
MHFSRELRIEFERLQPLIIARLQDFANVKPEEYFYELCFCICTPQSKAEHADAVAKLLQAQNFYGTGFDPTPLLRDKTHYIRFHNTKAMRLLRVRQQWPEIASLLVSGTSSEEKRDWLAENVDGFGYKEAAHFLRNIGYRNLPILDRHILKHLVACGVFNELPMISTKARYMAAGEAFKTFGQHVGISMDELDLFFWALEAGLILK